MAWPDTSLILEAALELDADLTADPSAYAFATDITSYVFDRDGNSSVVIQRGRQDETTRSQPSTIDLTLDNTDGRFSPRYPLGAYYPNLRRNTPIRVRVNPGSGLNTRAVGFISEFPSRWDVAEVDFHVPAHADGVLRRLGQGQTPLKSAMRRRVLSPDEPTPLAYWPCEDQEGSTQVRSGLLTGAPMLGPTPHFASGISGSDGALDLNGVAIFAIHGPITLPSVEGFQVEATVLSNLGVNTAILNVANFNSPTPWSVSTTLHAALADGEPHHYAWRFTQNGADIDVTTYRDGVFFSTVTPVTATIGTLIDVAVPGEVLADQVLISHIAVYSFADMDVPTTRAAAVDGYAGEISGTRFARLCTEESVPADVTAGSTEAMGPQTPKTLLDLLRECEAAEEGLIVERKTGELGFDPHSVRENLTVALTLNYAAQQVSPPLEPIDDDQKIRNDVTVTRPGGSSGQFVDENGPLGVTAVGRYDEGVTLNLFTDDQPVQHASWRVNLGTVDLLRFPTVTVNLRRQSSLVASWLALDVGSRIQITNVPDAVSYDTVDLIVEGYTEQISQKNWIITFNCAPYKPYGAFELSDDTADASEFVGRLAADASTLHAAVDSDDTSWSVVPNGARWTTVADDFDPDIPVLIGGERVNVSAIVDAAAFVAAGTAAHADNADVVPGLPAGMQAGDLMLILAAIRNESAGTVNVPSGYTSILQLANLRLMGKVHSGSESAPTVTFNGGAAGDDTSAQMSAFRGMATGLANLGRLSFVSDSNSSAQNIAYKTLDMESVAVDDYVELLIAWKKDDWTSVAPPTGFTEIGEPSTTTGNDQGIYWAYQIRTLHADEPKGSIVVTGGATAISSSALVPMAGLQTFTAVRSVNGVVKSHSVGAVLEVDPAWVLAL